jgi:release factor glutamine methyltransferase
VQLKSYKQQLIKALQQRYAEREARQIAIRLLDEILGLSRAQQVIEAGSELEPKLLGDLEQAQKELLAGMPLDYILGKSVFFGYDFIVNQEVLIPRPETEELVQLILEKEKDIDIAILDIGTGSGCIPIALKLEGNYQQVEACEVSKTALAIAQQNAKQLKAEVELFLMDILVETPNMQYDVIVSNPPYVFAEELQALEPHVKEFEPKIALSPEGEPLLFYKRILSIMPEIAKEGSRIYFEIHEDMGAEVEVLMRHHGLQSVEVLEDMYGRDRFAFGIYAS